MLNCFCVERPKWKGLAGLGVVLSLVLTGVTAHAQIQIPNAAPVRSPDAPNPDLAADSTKSTVMRPAPSKGRVRLVALGIGGGSAAVVGTLGATWYTGKKEPFRWFDDSREWAQIDKAGHIWGAFQESRASVDALRWAGLSKKKALWWGAPMGIVLQSTIEYFDGRSPGYGASASDLGANVIGTALFTTQVALWDEPRIWPKMGTHFTSFARLRPNTLGRSSLERLLKDYNGQTHWLTADVGAFLGPDTRWPRWLHAAVGYGAENLVYGEPAQNEAAGYRAYRQFYIGPDFHLLNIKTRSKVLHRLFYVLSIIRLPAPALEVRSTGGVRFHPLYF